MENDMTLRHPYEWISETSRKKVFLVLLVLTIIVMVGEQVTGGPLKTAAAPAGIVSFELAGTINQAHIILDSWGTHGQIYAGLNLGLDYLFMVLYATTIGLGCILIAQNLGKRVPIFGSVGILLAWALIIAALLDATENYALIQILVGCGKAIWASLARWCAIFKFLIVAVGLVYVIVGGIGVLVTRDRTV